MTVLPLNLTQLLPAQRYVIPSFFEIVRRGLFIFTFIAVIMVVPVIIINQILFIKY